MSSTATVSVVPRQQVATRGVKLTWEEPPPINQAHGGSMVYDGITSALRERPGEWAIIKEFPRAHAKRGWSLSSRINRGKGTTWDTGFYEAAARTVDDVVRVYVRYTGPASVAAVPSEVSA